MPYTYRLGDEVVNGPTLVFSMLARLVVVVLGCAFIAHALPFASFLQVLLVVIGLVLIVGAKDVVLKFID